MVILNLDKPRELKFSHKAMQKFSTLTKTPLTAMGEAVQRYDLVSAAVYCMLSVADDSLTPGQVDDMLENLTVQEIYTAGVQAMRDALGDGEESVDPDASENPQEAAGAGGRA